ncbi:MAG: hypothetical protein KKA81_01935 [Bacteroidetes bacterium]|nr:hypothetical protein [Bacteroidota bacterium]
MTIITSILITFFYFLYVYRHYLAGNMELLNDLKFCGTVILIMIPVSMVAHIIVYILFNIIYKITTREAIPEKSDELDKLIELKSTNITHYIFILGFLLAMGSLVIGKPPYVMLLVLVGSMMVSCILGELAKLCYYRKGV